MDSHCGLRWPWAPWWVVLESSVAADADILLKAVQYAKAMGLKVIGIDVSDSQLQAVRELGADTTINTLKEPDFQIKVKRITSGGCDAAAVFSASNMAYESAPKTLR